MRDAIEAAFCRAVRVTLVGSMTPGLDQIFVLPSRRVKSVIGVLMTPHPLHHDGAFRFGVVDNLAQRLLAGATHNRDAELLVTFELQLLRSDRSAQQSRFSFIKFCFVLPVNPLSSIDAVDAASSLRKSQHVELTFRNSRPRIALFRSAAPVRSFRLLHFGPCHSRSCRFAK